MATAPPGDPDGPQRLVCVACTLPMLDDDGQPLRDEFGFRRFHCLACIGRHLDRLCECFLCPWLREDP